jgi:hypothetical protein
MRRRAVRAMKSNQFFSARKLMSSGESGSEPGAGYWEGALVTKVSSDARGGPRTEPQVYQLNRETTKKSRYRPRGQTSELLRP